MLSIAKILENMEIGHNVMHGQWDWMRDPRSLVDVGVGQRLVLGRGGSTRTTHAPPTPTSSAGPRRGLQDPCACPRSRSGTIATWVTRSTTSCLSLFFEYGVAPARPGSRKLVARGEAVVTAGLAAPDQVDRPQGQAADPQDTWRSGAGRCVLPARAGRQSHRERGAFAIWSHAVIFC
ncbi:hypothetical protein HBB16_17035 [Pseudonocardia sp. MCCB 268]|nr:hypothetical protein [Pseudonocardia cytotoxica]